MTANERAHRVINLFRWRHQASSMHCADAAMEDLEELIAQEIREAVNTKPCACNPPAGHVPTAEEWEKRLGPKPGSV